MRYILNYHLNNKLRLCITQSNDQLIDFEDLLEFISRAQDLYIKNSRFYSQTYSVNQNLLVVPSIPILRLPKTGCVTQPSLSKPNSLKSSRMTSLSISQAAETQAVTSVETTTPIPPHFDLVSLCNAKIDGNGWIQINNVYLPFIVKYQQRLIPYPIVLSCKLLEPNQLQSVLIRATSTDLALINSMIQSCKINSQLIPEDSLLINVYHILIGTNNLVYAKILPTDNPTSKIHYQYTDVLSLNGGALDIASCLIPFVYLSLNLYIPLNSIVTIYPNLYSKLKPLARAPHKNELDYLQLVLLYFDKKITVTDDVLLVNIKELHETEILLPKMTSLVEYHAAEKDKFDEYQSSLNNQSLNKRKTQQVNVNKKSKKKLKLSNQTNRSANWNIYPITGYFPVQPALLFCNQQHVWFSSNNRQSRIRLH